MNHEVVEFLQASYAQKMMKDPSYVDKATQELINAPDFKERATLQKIERELKKKESLQEILKPFALTELANAVAGNQWEQVEKLARCLHALDAMTGAEISQAVDSVLDAGDVVVGGVYA